MADIKLNLSCGLDTVIAPVTRTVSSLLEAMLSESAQALGQAAKNQINWWNFQNVLRKVQRAKELIKSQGLIEEEIDLNFLVPWLRAAADVDDPELDNLWSQLLANASNSSKARRALFIHTLQSLSPGAAKVASTNYF